MALLLDFERDASSSDSLSLRRLFRAWDPEGLAAADMTIDAETNGHEKVLHVLNNMVERQIRRTVYIWRKLGAVISQQA